MRKTIVLDDTTRKFLGLLSSERQKAGLTLRELAEAMRELLGTVKMYELGLNYPSLPNLMKLAEVFGYDLSGSVNYDIYQRKISPRMAKRELRRYGLSYAEVSELTGYAKANIYAAINQKRYGSLKCLASVLEVLKQERELEHLR